VIHGHVEEALNLVSVQIHRNETLNTGHRHEVGDEFGADGHAWFVLAILPGPTKVRHHGDDLGR